ncbi:hypothetical protein DVH24_041892 [Malus domestica]|uniref:Thiamin pyrophosphokinase thiamin-binding domain-containing protein n=1 Tax=Malus domestica TaxID=3750 RepID=A0A498ISE5_MALDO|nr:hypothetical protein DVH24_041892 [Malus domestica]
MTCDTRPLAVSSLDPLLRSFASYVAFDVAVGTQIINESEDQDTTDLHKCIAYICDSAPNLDKSNVCCVLLSFQHSFCFSTGIESDFVVMSIGNINVLCRFSNIQIILISDDCFIHLHTAMRSIFSLLLKALIVDSYPLGCHLEVLQPLDFNGISVTETEMRFGGLISTSNIVKGEKITVQSDSDLLWTISIKKM